MARNQLINMKIILLKDVRNVGRIGEIKEVTSGYAANSLFPRKLAEIATPERIAQHEAMQEAHHKEEAARETVLISHIKEMSGAHLTITARTTPKGGLFKTITAVDIARLIREQKEVEIPAEVIKLDQPIKTAGEYGIGMAYKNIQGHITCSVTAL